MWRVYKGKKIKYPEKLSLKNRDISFYREISALFYKIIKNKNTYRTFDAIIAHYVELLTG